MSPSRLDGSRNISRILIEGEVRAPDDWKKRLCCGSAILDHLSAQGVLRRSAADKIGLRLDFVGIMSLSHATFFAMPKVYGPGGKVVTAAEVFRTLRCIQRYQGRFMQRAAKLPAAGESFFDEAGARLTLFLQLLAWTRDHGLHEEEVTSLTDDLDHIDWGDTIARGLSLHLRTGSIFSEQYGRREVGQKSDLATAQAVILLSLFEELGIIGQLWISEHDPLVAMCKEKRADAYPLAGEFQYIRRIVTEADLHATKDHERELISILKRWMTASHRGNTITRLFGLNAFHTVWEDMCAVALGDRGKTDHTKIASQPVHAMDSAEITISPQRPDHVLEETDGIIIADAKWYRTWKNEFPQLSDVIKQFMYQLTVISKSPIRTNAFLVPLAKPGHSMQLLGTTILRCGSVVDSRFPPLSIVGAGWDMLVEAYIAENSIPELRSFLKQPASLVTA